MKYRLATLQDVSSLVYLRLQSLKETYPQEFVDPKMLSTELENYFTHHIPTGEFISWLAIVDGQIAGTGGICFHKYPPSFRSPVQVRSYILNIYTLPAFRNMGIAKTIFSKLIDEARQQGAYLVSLHASEMAKQMYRKMGFVEQSNEMTFVIGSESGGARHSITSNSSRYTTQQMVYAECR